jgi:hypothetical protein
MIKHLLIIVALLITSLPAHAGQSEAREVARINNCPPKKIDVFQSSLGGADKTVYQVTCNLPKTTDKDAAAGPDALLIECDGALCELMRPISLSK